MTPLRYSNIPIQAKTLGIYIDGFHVSLENKPYIKDSKIYLPIDETVSNIDSDVEIMAYDAYSFENIDGVAFAEAKYFEEKLGVSIAWEDSTHSLYVASDYHYDGYRKAPLKIFEDIVYAYNRMFMYVDGSIMSINNKISEINTENGVINILGANQNLTSGKTYRFCFSYDAEQSKKGRPFGRLMELVEPISQYKDGYIFYTKESWEEAEQNKHKATSNIVTNKVINKVQKNCQEKRESSPIWNNPEMNGKKVIGEIEYIHPANWRFVENKPPRKGCYYYPYEKNEEGMVWITYADNNIGVSGRELPFNGIISGMCKSEENIISISDVDVAGVFGQKVRYYTKLREDLMFECVAVVFATDACIYTIVFGEKNDISTEMLVYADEFIRGIRFRNEDESSLAEEYYQKGHAYHHGDGVECNYSLAAQWYEKAVALGHVLASNNLGVLLFNGLGVSKDIERGIELMLYAGEHGDVIALNNIGRFYRDGKYVKKDVNKALELFKKADEKDDGTAAYLIALMYQDGVLEQNYKLANDWFRKALGKGFTQAALSLGMNIQDGKGEMQNYTLAKTYFDIAATNTNKDVSSAALFQMALLYLDGKGVEKSIDIAKQFILRAAENKSDKTYYAVGTFFEDERIGDFEEAKKWYEAAASLGNEEAKRKLSHQNQMSLDEIKELLDKLKQFQKDNTVPSDHNSDDDEYEESEFDPSSWSEESYLRSKGYTVSQQEGLSDFQRQRILSEVIDSEKMSKYQIINHLEAMISLRKYQSKYSIAIGKWERDIDFVRKYRG